MLTAVDLAREMIVKQWWMSVVSHSLAASLLMVAAANAAEPVSVKDGKAALSPENTHVKFVCAHKGDKPDPRTGTFTKFTGTAGADAAAKTLKSLALEFDTTSISTEFGKLTAHLKGPDFFDTREHPKASFTSKSITPGTAAGEYKVTGDLTLHGVTKEISGPAKVTFTDKGFTLTSTLTIDRSEFGIKYGLDKVEKDVAITFVIGEKNKVLTEAK